MFPLLNIGQELFEAFSKGIAGFQYWGPIAGVLIFILLILKPILTHFNNIQSPQEYKIPLSELTRFYVKFKELENNIDVKSNILIKDFYNLKYENINSLIFFTNTDLTSVDVNEFFNVLLTSKMTSGYIVGKHSEPDNNIFNEAVKKFDLRSSMITKEAVHIIPAQNFNLNIFFTSELKSDIVLNKLKIFDSDGNVLNHSR